MNSWCEIWGKKKVEVSRREMYSAAGAEPSEEAHETFYLDI